MATKIVQVPMDVALLEKLDGLSKQEGRSRSEVIREACRHYLKILALDAMEREYEAGYRRDPEDPALADAQVALAGEVLPAESW